MEANDKIKTKRSKFAIALRDNLIKNVDELESWHARFNPSKWLLLRLKSPSVDKELASEITSRVGSLATLKTLRNELAAQETKRDSAPFGFFEENLAKIMAKIDSSRFGLPSCHRAIKHQKLEGTPSAYDLLFNAPPDATANRSLKEILIGEPYGTPLNKRMDMAIGLARAVLFLHAFNFVHKSIRPENVIIFRSGKAKLGKPYLVGFEKFRLDTTGTHHVGDDL